MESRSKVFRSGFAEIWQREMGLSSSLKFTRRINSSEAILKQIDLYGKLNGHKGCVNSVCFNSTGDFLASGSDDMEVMFWNWTTKTKMFSYLSGHSNNIFQVTIMPFTDDRMVVTSAADGQVRLGEVLESGMVNTKKLGQHHGGVHNLAVEPGSPHIFFSCGEDAFVQHFDLRSHSSAKLFWCSRLTKNKRPRGSVGLHAIVIDPRNPNYFAVGGYDGYVRVYDIRSCQHDASSSADRPVNTFCPHHLIGSENVHITGLAYSKTSELLASYSDELVYLFQKNMGLGPNPYDILPEDLQKLDKPQLYSGHRNSRTVKGVNFFGSNDEFVMSGSDCGHIFIWRKKGGEIMRLMVGDRDVVNCLESHPSLPVIASSGIEKNVKLWAPLAKGCIPLPTNVQEIMAANRQDREDYSQTTLTPDVIMHVLRLHSRAYIERTYAGVDFESDEDETLTHDVGVPGVDASSEEGFTDDPRECNIS
ncbi:Ddb1- and cul4-associated factor [Thalictrum thalictroides]|uniref:Ddb1- and cul4-associated factor n=1 Tax=Thalictrum thalictroides TaxID=46969 RepID=A0A7J6XB21_THATH|nr:Ddb1- and cul4-associated factor [Thalictrum thalictroides]